MNRYYLHRMLRKHNMRVDARSKTIYVYHDESEFSDKQRYYMDKARGIGYSIQIEIR